MKRIIIGIIFQLMLVALCVTAQVKPVSSVQLAEFKAQLAAVNATFVYPEGVKEVKTPNNERYHYQFGIKLLDSDCEIWFGVNSTRADWVRFEKDHRQSINPDSLYIKAANDQANLLAGEGKYIARYASNYLLTKYNADTGRSYFLNLMDVPETNHYQYGLLIVLQNNHYGTLTALCMSNDKGPSFFSNLRKLQDCIKFIN